MRSHLHRLRFSALTVLLALAAIFLLRPLVMTAQDKAHDHAEKGEADKKHDDNKKHDDGHGKKADGTSGDLTTVIPQLLHVIDVPYFHFFDATPHIALPKILGFQITKYMLLEVIAALLIIIIYVPLAHRLKSGEPARGVIANTFEVLLTFVRDQIAKPNLGAHTDRYVPFLWTLFLFVLFNNLLGMLPFGGSATASPFVTFAMALIVFFAIHGAAIYEMGTAPDHDHDHGHGHDDHAHAEHGHVHGHAAEPAGFGDIVKKGSVRYIQSFWPHIDLPALPLGLPIKALVFCLELMGVLVRNGVLAIRLFANMFAGHMVTATILFFIKLTAELHPALWATVTASSVLGIVALSLLELFVAFLQAYIFTFLTSLFMGMAMSPQH